MIIKSADFVVSNTDYKLCPPPTRPEYAMIGRSNVGKSSLINMLTDHKDLAKTSAKPGKTQLINHFIINDHWYLVDLPGYGWAAVGKQKKAEFSQMIQAYLRHRENLQCIFVLVDSRLPPQAIDIDFINWLGKNAVPFVIVFTKADKQSITKTGDNIHVFVDKMLETWEVMPQYFVTSSARKEGKEEILFFIDGINRNYNS